MAALTPGQAKRPRDAAPDARDAGSAAACGRKDEGGVGGIERCADIRRIAQPDAARGCQLDTIPDLDRAGESGDKIGLAQAQGERGIEQGEEQDREHPEQRQHPAIGTHDAKYQCQRGPRQHQRNGALGGNDQRGASTRSISCVTMSSARRPSISAAGERTTRCRNSGWASSLTSSGMT
eukprot:Opistho-1_new@25274